MIVVGIAVKPLKRLKTRFITTKITKVTATKKYHAKSQANIKYGGDPNQKFDFYAPGSYTDTLMVIVHGGAWVLGDKGQFTLDSIFFSRKGISVANMNYRLAPD